MKEFLTTNGYKIQVDDEDYPWVSLHNWHAKVDSYGNITCIARTKYLGGGRKASRFRNILLAREILKCPANLEPDHKDRNSCNNQKSNLRIATRSQNMANRKWKINKTGYKGVGKDRNGKFYAQCKKQRIYGFAYSKDAAKAYDNMALLEYGSFSVLNFTGVK